MAKVFSGLSQSACQELLLAAKRDWGRGWQLLPDAVKSAFLTERLFFWAASVLEVAPDQVSGPRLRAWRRNLLDYCGLEDG